MIKYLVLWLLAINIAYADDLKLVSAARKQVGITKQYDPNYSRLDYPNGDVARTKGVCTDVLIRALRDAYQLDLQKLVHEDMAKHFVLYPKKWGLKKADTNIDHRRVPNLQVYFARHWQKVALSQVAADYHAGDVVTVMLPGNLPHIMLVSDKLDLLTNTPFVIHNIGRGTREEAGLFSYPMTGHYRLRI